MQDFQKELKIRAGGSADGHGTRKGRRITGRDDGVRRYASQRSLGRRTLARCF